MKRQTDEVLDVLFEMDKGQAQTVSRKEILIENCW